MSDEKYVLFRGFRLLQSDAKNYEREMLEADGGGNSSQRRDARKKVDAKYEALHVPEITMEQMFVFSDDDVTDSERNEAIKLILEHLNLKIVKTNATKHGNTEMVLLPADK